MPQEKGARLLPDAKSPRSQPNKNLNCKQDRKPLLTRVTLEELAIIIENNPDDFGGPAESWNPSEWNSASAALRYGRDLPAIERPRRPLRPREEVARLVAGLAADVLRARRPGEALARMARSLARHVEREIGLDDAEAAIEAVGLAGGVDFPAIDRALHQLWVSA